MNELTIRTQSQGVLVGLLAIVVLALANPVQIEIDPLTLGALACLFRR